MFPVVSPFVCECSQHLDHAMFPVQRVDFPLYALLFIWYSEHLEGDGATIFEHVSRSDLQQIRTLQF